MEIPQEKFDIVKKEAEEFYRSIGEVYCPYLKNKVSFNAKGLEHIKFKERGKARLVTDQYIRLKLLKLAPKIISSSHTLQEYFETKKFENVNANSRWQYKVVEVVYYGFVAIVNQARIKIIIKQIDGSDKFFWSLIPFWKNDKRNSENKKILHAGDLENN